MSAADGGYDAVAADDVDGRCRRRARHSKRSFRSEPRRTPLLLVEEGGSAHLHRSRLSHSALSGDVTVTVGGHVGTDVTLSERVAGVHPR